MSEKCPERPDKTDSDVFPGVSSVWRGGVHEAKNPQKHGLLSGYKDASGARPPNSPTERITLLTWGTC